MVTSSNCRHPYETELTNGSLTIHADTTANKGGGGRGFRPHELLEAALASCMNIHLRMYAANHSIRLERVQVTVNIDRSDDASSVFNYSIEILGDLDDRQRSKLLQIAETCPVRRTLSKEIEFQAVRNTSASAGNSG